MEEHITFESDGLTIEGLLEIGKTNKGIVITHPHPHYGGNMHNSVVELIKCVGTEHGYSTLRFNFRGTGSSEGHFDEGLGDQNDLLDCRRLPQGERRRANRSWRLFFWRMDYFRMFQKQGADGRSGDDGFASG